MHKEKHHTQSTHSGAWWSKTINETQSEYVSGRHHIPCHIGIERIKEFLKALSSDSVDPESWVMEVLLKDTEGSGCELGHRWADQGQLNGAGGSGWTKEASKWIMRTSHSEEMNKQVNQWHWSEAIIITGLIMDVLYVWVSVCACVCVCVYISVYVCGFVCLYLCMYVWMCLL